MASNIAPVWRATGCFFRAAARIGRLRKIAPRRGFTLFLTARFPAETHLSMAQLRLDQGGLLLTRWLAAAGRTLQPEQRAALLRVFDVEGSPLWLRTAAEEASRLCSWMPPLELPSTTAGLVHQLIGRLSSENEHGTVLVERTLGYLACSRQGLSEDEILDLLSDDKEVMSDFRRRFPKSPPVETLPVAAWVPLLGDIDPFFSESEAHGASLLRFYHRVLLETVESSILSEVGARLRNHQMMATYFTRQARGTNAARIWDSTHARGFAECVFHQANAELWDDVEQTLSDFGFLIQKTRLNMLEGLFDDWTIVDTQTPADTCLRLEPVRGYFHEKAHILRVGNAGWPAYKILLQLAVEHADDSPLTLGAERWLAEERCDWTWLRRNRRPPRAQANPCLGVLGGHSSGVLGAVLLSTGEILSWSDDCTLRLWDYRAGKCLAILGGHTRSVKGAIELRKGRILSWSMDNTLRLWDHSSDSCLAVLEGHSGAVLGALALANGRILSWSEDGSLRVWESRSGKPLAVLRGHESRVNGATVLASGHILSWSGAFSDMHAEVLRLWDSRSELCLGTLVGHSKLVGGAVGLKDGRILSWAEDNSLRFWDDPSGRNLAVLKGHTYLVLGATELPDGRILSWSADGTLRFWESQSGKCLAVLKGHPHRVMGARVLPDGSNSFLVVGQNPSTLGWPDGEISGGPRRAHRRDWRRLALPQGPDFFLVGRQHPPAVG